MTGIPTISDISTEMIGPGRLVLVVGPSGAGKDTLIDLARAVCGNDQGIVFPRRVITREASSSENNRMVSPEIFAQMRASGDFAFYWQAHGLSYGLPLSIAADISAGSTVVANVSRTVIEDARRRFRNVVVVLVTAPPEVLAARLSARSRASDGRLDDRLQRAVIADVDVTIENVGYAQDKAAELLKIFKDV